MTALEVRGLAKAFPRPGGGTTRVLDVAEFNLQAGEQIALRGESGSGKTTFLHCISGILAVDTGLVSIGGKTMSGLGEGKRDRLRAETVGYIFQSFNLLQGLNCLENLQLAMAFRGLGPDRDRALTLLRRVGLQDRASHRPRELSIGQQQRVAVARALVNRPTLLLADEPTGNLDRRNANEVVALIREVCAADRTSLILVSHDEGVLGGFETVRDFAEINRAARKAAA